MKTSRNYRNGKKGGKSRKHNTIRGRGGKSRKVGKRGGGSYEGASFAF